MSLTRKIVVEVLLCLVLLLAMIPFNAFIQASWWSALPMLAILVPVGVFWQDCFRKLLTPRQP